MHAVLALRHATVHTKPTRLTVSLKQGLIKQRCVNQFAMSDRFNNIAVVFVTFECP